jgi:Flp pilus assembly protein TadB
MAFGKKNENVEEREIIGFTKPRSFLFFKIKPRPIYRTKTAAGTVTVQGAEEAAKPQGRFMQYDRYINSLVATHKDLEISLREQRISEGSVAFVSRVVRYSAITAVVVTILTLIILQSLGVSLLLAPLLGISVYLLALNQMVTFPIRKVKNRGQDVEKDVLFAARDMIVSMRSGMPLFNAMATVSVGYGAASLEFAKIIELIQLGMPIEQAIEEVSNKSGSKTFKRLMLQAGTSIKAGADVIDAIQEVINEVSQERVIELRRYGQRLNAIAMFYMLFGIIFPSMGIAVAAALNRGMSKGLDTAPYDRHSHPGIVRI